MMRIALFLLTNLAVMLVFGLVLSLTGIQSSSVQGLMIMALLFGFGGSFISLLMSKWMALKSVGGEVIEQPRNDMERWLMETVAQQSRQLPDAGEDAFEILFRLRMFRRHGLPADLFKNFVQLLFKRRRGERFHHVAAGTGLRGGDDVLFLRFGSDHQHRHGFQVHIVANFRQQL